MVDRVAVDRVVFFEREAALKDSALWWVTCLANKVLQSVYRLMINLVDWLGLTYMWSNGVGQNREETNEKHNEDCIEERFQLARVKFDRDDEGVREALGVRN